MYSSQEDLFADNFKSILPDRVEDSFCEVEIPAVRPKSNIVQHVFPNSNICINIVMSPTENDQIMCFSVNIELKDASKT